MVSACASRGYSVSSRAETSHITPNHLLKLLSLSRTQFDSMPTSKGAKTSFPLPSLAFEPFAPFACVSVRVQLHFIVSACSLLSAQNLHPPSASLFLCSRDESRYEIFLWAGLHGPRRGAATAPTLPSRYVARKACAYLTEVSLTTLLIPSHSPHVRGSHTSYLTSRNSAPRSSTGVRPAGWHSSIRA